MKILFLAPEPFFQERGTPIAVRLALEVLAKRQGDKIVLLTYHEGTSVNIPNVRTHRIKAPKWLKGVGPGISIKKLICDFILFVTAIKLIVKNKKNQYDLIHAVEESVFIAAFIKCFFRIPYIYDMDSSLAIQVSEKWRFLKPFRFILDAFEKFAIKHSAAVVPVCDALAVIAYRHGSYDTCILRDISLLDVEGYNAEAENLKKELSIPEDYLSIIYIGNLEKYQGIDLLIESFAKAAKEHKKSALIIIGGNERHIKYYKKLADDLQVGERVYLIGPRPVSSLNNYLIQADILASPRTLGNNTPMKIYSYLHSGKPLIATALPTHTQVLDDNVAVLAEPNPADFSDKLLKLLNDDKLREQVGSNAFKLAEKEYTFKIFSTKLNELYDRLGERFNNE